MDPGSGRGKFNLIPVIFYNLSMNTVSGKRAQFSQRIGWAKKIQGFQRQNEMSMISDISDQREKICTHKTS
jgi:hypothetical protein